jgi:hypothetical protein
LGANRIKTLAEFKQRLAAPVVIKLNQKPLREDWNRYPMLPPGDRLTADEFKAVEKVVRDRGEKFPMSISVSDADHATVNVGDGTFFQVAKAYSVVRSAGTWRVENVKTIKAASWVVE